MQNIGKALKNIRTSLGKTLKEVAKDLDITVSYLCSVENGMVPHMKYVNRLIDYYGVNNFILVMWHMIDVSDIPEANRGIYGVMKPTIDDVFNNLFKTKK